MTEIYHLHEQCGYEVILSMVEKLKSGDKLILHVNNRLWNVALFQKASILRLKGLDEILDWCIVTHHLKDVSKWLIMEKSTYRVIHKLRHDACIFWVSPNGLFKRKIIIKSLSRIGLYFCHDSILSRITSLINEPLIMAISKAPSPLDFGDHSPLTEHNLLDEKINLG
ncbi:MAG TPA: hypothetical protein QF353_01260 [Gammaproteobacteria bacterium]|nr:hypothetical protein [Gammaproteobacteria bacterium]